MKPVTRKVGNHRLLVLAKFLEENVPRERFDFSFIVHTPDGTKRGYGPECGTVGCAIGWMPAVPEFRSLGVRLVQYPRDPSCEYVELGRGRTDFGVARGLFGLSVDEANYLFQPGPEGLGYSGLPPRATPKQVAKHIRRWVKDHPAEKKS